MWRRMSTLRLRLTLSYMLVFGLIQAAVCVAIIAHREHRDRDDFDARLVEQARAVGQVAELAGDGAAHGVRPEDVDAVTATIDRERLYYAIRQADGTLVARSPQLERIDLELPLPELEALRRQRDMYATLADAGAERLLGEKGALRVVNHYHVPAIGAPLIVQLAVDHQALRVHQQERREMFLAISLLALVPAGLTTWLLAKRSLRPLAQVAEQVNVISPRELDQRIHVDDSSAELARLTRTVNEMLDRLHKAFRAQDRFLTNAAHELKTPLAILMGEAQVLSQRARTPEEYARYLRETESEMRRLGKTVDGLLMLARSDTRDPDLHPISANDFVTDAVERCQSLARRWDVRLALHLAMCGADGVEPIVRGDPRLLSTMVENLIRTAMRMSSAEGIVDIAVAIAEERVAISVRDGGAPLSPDAQADGFERYVRRPDAGRVASDTGIGLLIVQSVIQLHGGRVTSTNRPEGGAELTVSLPLGAGPASHLPA